ncbi:unnamed protein product [Blepharisma stoltei]|uniref:Uncharacterized protein n=1 Tax=Blepharisma stoltei TaxID=1481888 RepID=A0AAU9JZ14_9CILI|nr:unnamed protein product [Blepharisma stoltei]
MALDKIPEIDECYECDDGGYEKFMLKQHQENEAKRLVSAAFDIKKLISQSTRLGIYAYILFRFLLKYTSKIESLSTLCKVFSKYKNFAIVLCLLSSLGINYFVKTKEVPQVLKLAEKKRKN